VRALAWHGKRDVRVDGVAVPVIQFVSRIARHHGFEVLAVDPVLERRGGTFSLSGVSGGDADPMPMKTMFDRPLTLRMGQCNVKRWTDDLMPLGQAPELYETFQKKQGGCMKVVLKPNGAS
jgi:threonine dehydrogenase-like Zn-dependent dehydrogenase